MTYTTFGRTALASLGAALLLLSAVAITGLASDATEDHPVVGRWAITSDTGGAVWAFQPSGALVVTGPGEIMSEGSWTAASAPDEVDAIIDAQITGQVAHGPGAGVARWVRDRALRHRHRSHAPR